MALNTNNCCETLTNDWNHEYELTNSFEINMLQACLRIGFIQEIDEISSISRFMRQFLQYFSNAEGSGIECLGSDFIIHSCIHV